MNTLLNDEKISIYQKPNQSNTGKDVERLQIVTDGVKFESDTIKLFKKPILHRLMNQ